MRVPSVGCSAGLKLNLGGPGQLPMNLPGKDACFAWFVTGTCFLHCGLAHVCCLPLGMGTAASARLASPYFSESLSASQCQPSVCSETQQCLGSYLGCLPTLNCFEGVFGQIKWGWSMWRFSSGHHVQGACDESLVKVVLTLAEKAEPSSYLGFRCPCCSRALSTPGWSA